MVESTSKNNGLIAESTSKNKFKVGYNVEGEDRHWHIDFCGTKHVFIMRLVKTSLES